MNSDAVSRSSTPSRILLWVRAARAPFLTASLAPALLGAFAARASAGALDYGKLIATLAGVSCIHLGANLANDYYDEKTGCDRRNPEPTPFSGGSRVIQEGLIDPRAIMAVSSLLFAAGAALGLHLNSLVPGNVVLYLCLAGVAGGFLYTALPVKLSYRGLGEIAVFFCFGPLAVTGSYFVQTGSLDYRALLASVPAGLLVLAILLVNEVLDVHWDRRAGKNTVVVRLGRERGYALFLVIYTAAYAYIGAGTISGLYPPAAVVSIVPFALSIRFLLPGRALRDREGNIGASRLTILSQALTVALLALSFLF